MHTGSATRHAEYRGTASLIPWMEAPPRSACSAKPWVFVKASKTGCEQAFCGTGSASERVCTCLSAGLVRVTLTWPVGSSTEFDVTPSIFNPFWPEQCSKLQTSTWTAMVAPRHS